MRGIVESNGLRVGQVARRAGVHVETIRFYERKGLLPEPRRTRSGYRVYTEETVHRLAFIRQAKALGFSLREIAELLSLKVEPGATCGMVRERVTRKIEEIDHKVRELRRMRAALQRLARACEGGEGPTGDCPILDALGADGEPGRSRGS